MAKPKNDPEISAVPATPAVVPTPEEPVAVSIPEQLEAAPDQPAAPEAMEQLPATSLAPFSPSGPGRAVQLAAHCPPDEVAAVATTVGITDPRRVYAWRDYPDGIVVITTDGQRIAGAVR